MGDREEAVVILNWFISELNKLSDKQAGDYDDIEEAKELLANWE